EESKDDEEMGASAQDASRPAQPPLGWRRWRDSSDIMEVLETIVPRLPRAKLSAVMETLPDPSRDGRARAARRKACENVLNLASRGQELTLLDRVRRARESLRRPIRPAIWTRTPLQWVLSGGKVETGIIAAIEQDPAESKRAADPPLWW